MIAPLLFVTEELVLLAKLQEMSGVYWIPPIESSSMVLLSTGGLVQRLLLVTVVVCCENQRAGG